MTLQPILKAVEYIPPFKHEQICKNISKVGAILVAKNVKLICFILKYYLMFSLVRCQSYTGFRKTLDSIEWECMAMVQI